MVREIVIIPHRKLVGFWGAVEYFIENCHLYGSDKYVMRADNCDVFVLDVPKCSVRRYVADVSGRGVRENC
jgi:hypothetical protein